jgi:hypothetical protein
MIAEIEDVGFVHIIIVLWKGLIDLYLETQTHQKYRSIKV